MKKVRNIILLALILIPVPSFATSGACSYHNGVNCSAGPSLNGKVQCNDGWVNSSVDFYNAKECQDDKHFCSESEFEELMEKYRISEKQNEINKLSDDLKEAFDGKYSSPTGSTEYDKYSNEFYEISMKLPGLQLDLKSDLAILDRECYAMGEKTYWENQANILKELEKKEQVPYIDKCIYNGILNSHEENGSCFCNDGYILNNLYNKCELDIPVVVPETQVVKNNPDKKDINQVSQIEENTPINAPKIGNEEILVNKINDTTDANPKKVKWYQKILNWLFNRSKKL